MEAKVDIRKLQLLNDRINQTIDALNQVRLSVHGLSHSAYGPGAGVWPGIGQVPQAWAQFPQAYGQSFGQVPQAFGQAYGQSFGQVPQAFGQTFGQMPYYPGLGHTSFVPQTMGNFPGLVNPLTQGFVNPLTQGIVNPLALQAQFAPWANNMIGLSHTSPDFTDVNRLYGFDPLSVMRYNQTFPNILNPVVQTY